MRTRILPRILPASAEDHAALAEIWRRSVLATHHFLPPGEVDRLYEAVRRVYLPCVADVRAAFLPEEAGPGGMRPVGFMGCNGFEADPRRADAPPRVEMLFVEPEYFGTGVGAALLAHARARAAGRGLALDVNEQNPGALAFYERQGFVRVGRSARDGEGRPYPLLHMEWRPLQGA